MKEYTLRASKRPLSNIADLRGLSEPFMYAADTLSKPGHMILQCLRVETICVPKDGQMLLKTLHSDNDPRLTFLAEAFGAPELARAIQGLLDLLGQSDPTGQAGDKRHEEWPIKIIAAKDAAQELCARLQMLQTMVNAVDP